MRYLSILYVGTLDNGGTCRQRMHALMDLGHSVTSIDTSVIGALSKPRQLLCRLSRRFGYSEDLAGSNRRILELVRSHTFDVLWIDKGLTIRPETLDEVKRRAPFVKIVSYSPDDMCGRHNQSTAYLESLALYDLHVTTKSYNVAELKE